MTRSAAAIFVAGDDAEAQTLAQRLALPRCADGAASQLPPEALILLRAEGRLTLRLAAQSDRGGYAADFTDLLKHPASARQPLLRALGERRGVIFDATAGLGHDSVLIASAGRQVLATERHPVLCALIEDGLARLAQHGQPINQRGAQLAARIDLHCADAINLLQKGTEPLAAVYLDPMYPPKPARRAHALPPLAMRLTRMLVGDDPDTPALLAAARASGATRVVVKRPHHAPPITDDVSFTIQSKLVRYDCFSVVSRSAAEE